MKKWIGLVLGLFLVSQGISAAEFVMNELPDFSDQQQWSYVETVPLSASIRGKPYVWGTIKRHRLRKDPNIVGYEEYAYGSSEPYFKTWGRETERPSYALKESGSGSWLVGPAGASWWEVRVDLDSAGKIKGMWVVLFVRSTSKVSGRYLADPTYQPPRSSPEARTHDPSGQGRDVRAAAQKEF